ncbi:MAG: tRNA pseudouridine(55) synthase TruB [Candidatus Omnitrophica bacterium]|nr:tRNA pseudouridine(55) synthase TruB [Candidatus Omnitrophota bacterium]
MTEGILIINKSQGITSHDVVYRIRRKLKIKKVGHAGTLDPLATGVLVVLLGKATKLSNQFVSFDKSYRATLLLGTVTDSADIDGKVTAQNPYEYLTQEKIKETIIKFQGEFDQIPPMVSAVKHNGKKLYQLARKGIVVERSARRVRIDRIVVENIELPYVKIYVECSKGMYVRQLAADIGEVLGCGACISQLQRTTVGKFKLEESVLLENLDESYIRHWEG